MSLMSGQLPTTSTTKNRSTIVPVKGGTAVVKRQQQPQVMNSNPSPSTASRRAAGGDEQLPKRVTASSNQVDVASKTSNAVVVELRKSKQVVLVGGVFKPPVAIYRVTLCQFSNSIF